MGMEKSRPDRRHGCEGYICQVLHEFVEVDKGFALPVGSAVNKYNEKI
ncbi:hypothetical protein LR021_06450 [Candidatus Bipolaricaulota bacterium]|nr:hypothetical protein [Candidatus Bipolaricaulota bacterium]